jgi:hypothetical protein
LYDHLSESQNSISYLNKIYITGLIIFVLIQKLSNQNNCMQCSEWSLFKYEYRTHAQKFYEQKAWNRYKPNTLGRSVSFRLEKSLGILTCKFSKDYLFTVSFVFSFNILCFIVQNIISFIFKNSNKLLYTSQSLWCFKLVSGIISMHLLT